MKRGEFFKTLLGAIALPFLPKQPERINLYPQRIEPLYMMTIGNALERLKQRIIDEQRQRADCIKDLTSVCVCD